MEIEDVSQAPVTRPSGSETSDAAVQSSTMPKDAAPRADAQPDTEGAGSEPQQSDRIDVDGLLETANTLARQSKLAVVFRKSEVRGHMILEVVDKSTGNVVRQIPPEEMERRMKFFAGFVGLLSESEG